MRTRKSKYLWLLDAGHGGIKDGLYVTAPNKMFTFPDGFTICEGVINRAVCKLLASQLDDLSIAYKKVYHEELDWSLRKRVSLADKYYSKDTTAIFLSTHSNAGGGSGNEIYTSVGQTKSDLVAEIFCNVYQNYFPEYPFRTDRLSDGDQDKEEEFYVLRKTDCPALLTESFFFDNRQEAEYLSSDHGQCRIAECLRVCIEETERQEPIKIIS